MDLVIRRAHVRGSPELVDIGIDGGKIEAIRPGIEAHGSREIDAGGGLVAPTFVEPHTHLDKALTADRCPPNRSGLIDEVVVNTTEVARTYTEEDVYTRATTVAGWFVQNGVTHIRTHVDIGPPVGLTGLEGVLAAREALRGVMRRGADIVGANTVAERTQADADRQIDVVFAIAREFDADVDIHCDSTDDPNATSLHYLAARTIELGYHGRVTAGHCCALSSYDPYYAAKVARLVREAGVSIV